MMKVAQFTFLFFFFCFTVAHAVSEDFSIRTLVGDDLAPPTTPTGLTVDPVAQTQIDLSWGASTDDFILGGYQVFRDASQIATTTLTSYSDTGLTSSTTYTYFVRAYDSFFNISSSSNSAATTTLPITPTSTPTTTPSNSSGGVERVELESFSLTPSQYSALLSWKTNRYAQFQLRWGRTSSYELGFVSSDLFKRENVTMITDLRPGTVYQFQLTSLDHDGRTRILKDGEFTTLDAPDTQAPANVSNLQAIVAEDDVRLTWVNPTDSDFSHVRVVRNYLFYPSDPYDGYVVYQNNGASYLDTNALKQKNSQYYTVFSYDTNGNISSGAIVSAYIKKVSVPLSPQASSTLFILNFADIELIQDNRLIASDDVAADLPITFRIAYEKLPEHLKTITISLKHPENPDAEFSFLLKINKDKTFYEATVASLKNAGIYPTTVSVFDHSAQQLSTVEGTLTVTRFENESTGFGIPLFVKDTKSFPMTSLLLWILLVLFLLLLLYRIVRSMPVRKNAAVGLYKTRMFASILLLCLFGGASSYILISLTKQSTIASLENTRAAASLLGLSDGPIIQMGIVLGVILIAVLICAVVITFLKKK